MALLQPVWQKTLPKTRLINRLATPAPTRRIRELNMNKLWLFSAKIVAKKSFGITPCNALINKHNNHVCSAGTAPFLRGLKPETLTLSFGISCRHRPVLEGIETNKSNEFVSK